MRCFFHRWTKWYDMSDGKIPVEGVWVRQSDETRRLALRWSYGTTVDV